MEELTCDICQRTFKSKDSRRQHMKRQHSDSQALKVYNRNDHSDEDSKQLNRYLDNNKDQLEISTWKRLKQKVNEPNEQKPKLIPIKPKSGLLRIKARKPPLTTYPLIPTGTKRKLVGQDRFVKRPDKRKGPRVQSNSLIPTGTKRQSSGQGGRVKRADLNEKSNVLRIYTDDSLIPTGTKRKSHVQGGLVKRPDRSEKNNIFRGVTYPKSLWFFCDLCDKSFRESQQLADHLVKQHPSCPKCREHFVDMKTYEEHWRKNHLEHQCFVCKNMFHDKEHLNDHLKIHPKCARCNQIFLNDQQLQKHWNENHMEAIASMPEVTDEEMSELSDKEDEEEDEEEDGWEEGE